MNRLLTLLIVFVLLSLISIQAQTFPRFAEFTTTSTQVRGFGGIVAGVDFDQDGMPEIYACNTNMVDWCFEITPRIFKFEWNGTEWVEVWAASTTNIGQNTWPALTWGDTDEDGKPELYWFPVENFDPVGDTCTAATDLNPVRLYVYEYPGDGSDNMGVADGLGGFLPNAQTTITQDQSDPTRPFRAKVADVDGDGKDEIIFVDRQAGNNLTSDLADMHVGVVSVNEIPDNGGGLEVWTIEFRGEGDINLTDTGNKWDLAILNNYIYLFDGNLTGGSKVWPVRYVSGNWETLPGQNGIAGGNSSFKGSEVVDINKDGTKEIIVAEWLGNAIGQGAKIWLLQQVADSLVSTEIADLESLGAVRLQASSFGDIDADGNLDFIVGSRREANNTAKVPIFRVEYQGGDITNPASYISSILDSAYWDKNGDMETYVANLDGDAADEVLYTQGYPRGNANDDPMPLIVLDLQFTPVSVELESSQVPSQFFLNQNFPNPFNPSTQIKFGITEAANVDLRIYDILGSEVAVVINNQYLAAGSYSTKFDAANLASGIYIYKLTAGANTVSKKMQLLK